LLLRIGVFESGLFANLRHAEVARGNFFALFTSWDRFGRFMRCILIGVPVWYIVGLFVVFLVEYLKHLPVPAGLAQEANTKVAITLCYAGIAFGDLASGMLSQVLRSRKRAILLFMLMSMAATAYYLAGWMTTLTEVYAVCTFMGFATGYWAVFVTVASEQFGTNLRATVTTSVPNFVRGSLPLIYLLNRTLRDESGLDMGFVPAAVTVGVVVFGLALWAWWGMRETFARDLDFVER
jgi:ABC-type dipeptide/oligopeptide/nickel transport system permease component